MRAYTTWLVLAGLFAAAGTAAAGGADETKPCSTHCWPGKHARHAIHISTGQEGGTYYEVGRALTKVLRESYGEKYIGFIKSEGSKDNLKHVLKPENTTDSTAIFGLVQSDVLDFEYGRDEYKDFKVVGAVYHEPVYVLARRKLQFSSIAELRGNTVAIGLPMSGTQHTSKTILGIFGLSLGTFEPRYLPYGQIADSLSEGEIHAAVIVNAGIPESVKPCIKENKADILRIRTDDLVDIASRDPHLYRLMDVRDPNAYCRADSGEQCSERTFRTIAVTAVLITHKDTPNEYVEALAKALCDTLFRPYVDPTRQIDWEKHPFRLYGKNLAAGLYHDRAIDYYENTDLYKDYWLHELRCAWFPIVTFAPVIVLLLLVGRSDRHRKLRFIRTHLTISFFLLACLLILDVLYISLYCLEAGSGNPDITGGYMDLVRVFFLFARVGDIACVNSQARWVRNIMMVLSGLFGLTLLGRMGIGWAEKKISEVFKMIPKDIHGHVLICNWTPKTEKIIKDLRSDVLRTVRPIIVVSKGREHEIHNIQARISQYAQVYVFPGDPEDRGVLEDKTLRTSSAKTILILADASRADESAAQAGRILASMIAVLRQSTAKPSIIIELPRPDRSLEEALRRRGAEHDLPIEVISSAEVSRKALAQAAITPASIHFVREILTVQRESNEVYTLAIPETMFKRWQTACNSHVRDCTFQDLACLVSARYKEQYGMPLVMIGFRPVRDGSKRYKSGRYYFNPTDDEMKKIHNDESVVTVDAVVLAWREPSELKGQ